MIKKYDVTAAGHICLDIIPEIPKTGITEISELFKPGKLIQVNAAKICTGGPVSNTGFALKKLGLNVAFMSRIGKDEFGELIVKRLAEQGEISGISISKKDRTAYTVVIAPPGIDRFYLHDPGANDSFSSKDINEKIISKTKIFHFGYPPLIAACYKNEGEELLKIMKLAKFSAAITSLDMTIPDPHSPAGKVNWKKILKKVLPFVDIFLPSIEEIFYMLEPGEYFKSKEKAGSNDMVDYIQPEKYPHLADACLEMGAKIVALKTAHRGFYVKTGDLEKYSDQFAEIEMDCNNWSNRELWCPAFFVPKIASATGSGDSSIAGFLAALLKGESIEKTLKYANCVGFQNLHELDAISGIKNWQETTEMIADEKIELIPVLLQNSDWEWEKKLGLWIGSRDNVFR